MAVLFHRQDLREQGLLEFVALVHVRAGAQLPDQLHQRLLGSPVSRVLQHLFERIQVVVQLHTTSVAGPICLRELICLDNPRLEESGQPT
jgi:hypothetical protein